MAYLIPIPLFHRFPFHSTDRVWPVVDDRNDARTISFLFSLFGVAAPTPNSIDYAVVISDAFSSRAILIRPMFVHRCATNPMYLHEHNVY